jgi:hypothetical protein
MDIPKEATHLVQIVGGVAIRALETARPGVVAGRVLAAAVEARQVAGAVESRHLAGGARGASIAGRLHCTMGTRQCYL